VNQINLNHNEPSDRSANWGATVVTVVTATMTSAVTAPTATVATPASLAATEITVAVPATSSSSRTDKKLLRKSKRIKNATSELQSDFYGEFKAHTSN
jgi:hypothetical protein